MSFQHYEILCPSKGILLCLKTHSKTLKCLFIYKTIKTKRLLVRSVQSIFNSDRVIIVQLQFKQLAIFAPILVPPQRKNILLKQKKIRKNKLSNWRKSINYL